jgi:site-specific recombinase XerD
MTPTSIILSNPQTLKPSNVSEFLDQFSASLHLKVRAHSISKDTATAYTRGAKRFIEWSTVNHKGLGMSDTILEWKADLLEAGYKPGAINSWMAGVRALFSWAVSKQIIQINPAADIPGAKRSGTTTRHARESLTDNEARRLLAIPDTSTPQGKRDYAILSLMLHTAVRTMELHRANMEDLQTKSGRWVLYIQGKGHDEKDDMVVISGAEDALRDWLAERDKKSTPVFHSLSNRSHGERLSLPAYRALIMRYMRLAGVQGNKTTHSLRHTAITKAIQMGVPLHKVSKGLARHADPKTTMIYYHEMDRIDDPPEDHIIY